MDKRFTEQLQKWVMTPAEEKDWDQGALLLLQLTGNKVMYRNISMNPKGKAEFIEGKLKQYLNFRLAEVTHEEVQTMQKMVDVIVKETVKPEKEFAEFKAGKRTDHDDLPEEIQVLYKQNLDIVHQMRELHMQLRNLSKANVTCPDSERYPFLKELIELDKQLRQNWYTYDHYKANTQSQSSTKSPQSQSSTKSPQSQSSTKSPKKPAKPKAESANKS